MQRFAGWMSCALMALACFAASAGWLPVPAEGTSVPLPEASAKAGSPAEDVLRLAALAQGAVGEDGRLWVVSARTSEELLRWSGADADEAIRWIERTEAAMPPEETPLWFVNVQGTLDGAASLTDAWAAVEADAVLVETYEDGGTISNSYDAAAFGGGLRSENGAVSLQVAAHLDTETGRWRMTLGTPVIMIEY